MIKILHLLEIYCASALLLKHFFMKTTPMNNDSVIGALVTFNLLFNNSAHTSSLLTQTGALCICAARHDESASENIER